MRRWLLLSMLATALVSCGGEVLTAYSMLTHDGRRLVSRLEGTNTVYVLVPTNSLPAGLRAVRPWRLYAVKATHTDIGLHNPPYVQRNGAVRFVEKAMALVDADWRDDADPAAYRYVMEGGWFWENYPMDRGEDAARAVISNYVRRGRIDIGAGFAGNHTHVFGPEELHRSTVMKRRLAETWGVGTRTLLMSDNPGLSWSVVRPYAEAGIENVLFSPNQWNPHPSTVRTANRRLWAAPWNPDAGGGGNYIDVRFDSDRPMVFRWESADASTNLLVWCSTHYASGYSRIGIRARGPIDSEDVERKMPSFLDLLERRYPYDVWLAAAYDDDEEPNTAFADFAAKWNGKWKYPEFHTVGRLDEPFDELRRRFWNDIPVVRGEMTSGWLQHVVSAPDCLADKLEAERKLVAAEEAWKTDPGRNPGFKTDIDRAWWCLLQNDEHSYGTSGYQGRRVFETWLQHRDWIDRAGETADCVARAEKMAPRRVVRREVNGSAENEYYRVRVNSRGEIESIYDKELERELLAGVANRFLYTRDNHRSWCDEMLLGARITRRVWLVEGAKRIDVEDRFEHAQDLFSTWRYYKFGYLAFPFAVPGGAFRAALAGGEVIDPYRDQSGYATDAYVASRDWCAVENGTFGVALFQRDSLLVEFGEVHADKTVLSGTAPVGKSAVYPFLFTDWLQMHQPGGVAMDFTFRFAITSYRGDWRTAGVPVQADRFVNPYRREECSPSKTAVSAAEFPKTEDGFWTGLVDRPRAIHGENDGQLYLLWPADLSPRFGHYRLYRDGEFLANVTNEVVEGVPYRVARYVDSGLGELQRVTYRIETVGRDGSRRWAYPPFTGMTRQRQEVVTLDNGEATVQVNLNGGQLMQWVANEVQPVFFLPRWCAWGEREVHGGIPVCWPWFGTPSDGNRPKHGIARYSKWRVEATDGCSRLHLSLSASEETLKMWPHEFRLDYTIRLIGKDRLELELGETNTGDVPYSTTCGFHPYLTVEDAHAVRVDGRLMPPHAVRERFSALSGGKSVEDALNGCRIRVSSDGFADWMVWNPDEARTPLCQTLEEDEWQRFYCVEPCTLSPTVLAPGERRSHRMSLAAYIPPEEAERRDAKRPVRAVATGGLRGPGTTDRLTGDIVRGGL